MYLTSDTCHNKGTLEGTRKLITLKQAHSPKQCLLKILQEGWNTCNGLPSNQLNSVNTCTWNRHLIQLSRDINEIQETRSRLRAWKGIQLEIANDNLIGPVMLSFGGCKLEMAKHMGRQELLVQKKFWQLYSADGIRLLFNVPQTLGNWTIISKMHSLEQLAQVVELLQKRADQVN